MTRAAVEPIGPPLSVERTTMSDVRGREVTDGELIERVGDGDRAAFEQLYRRYARPVLGLALRRLGDRASAEDAVQDAFAAVWRSAGRYRPERGAGAPWLYVVARNAIVDRARLRVDVPAEITEQPSSERSPAEHAELGWTRWRVHRALEELRASEIEVITLAYWRGLSQREVADSLGLPLGTVKTRTRAALARLAEILDGEDL